MEKKGKYTQEQAAQLIAKHHGYELIGTYLRRDRNVLVRCGTHGFEKEVRPGHLFAGSLMECCCRANSAERSRSRVGDKNPFYGKRHTPETIEALRNARTGVPGHPMTASQKKALLDANTGKPRPDDVRAKVRIGVMKKYLDFEYCTAKARNGKTAGKKGWFYIARTSSGLKFGSTTVGLAYRERRLKQQFGPETSMLVTCQVADCGGYKTAMMEAHRAHWQRSEHFRDFLLDSPPLL